MILLRKYSVVIKSLTSLSQCTALFLAQNSVVVDLSVYIPMLLGNAKTAKER